MFEVIFNGWARPEIMLVSVIVTTLLITLPIFWFPMKVTRGRSVEFRLMVLLLQIMIGFLSGAFGTRFILSQLPPLNKTETVSVYSDDLGEIKFKVCYERLVGDEGWPYMRICEGKVADEQ